MFMNSEVQSATFSNWMDDVDKATCPERIKMAVILRMSRFSIPYVTQTT